MRKRKNGIFNNKGYRTAKNAEFNRSSFKSMFKNVRYIGTYIYKDIEKENAIPAIIDKDLFETVQRRLSLTADAPARGKAKVEITFCQESCSAGIVEPL